MLREMLNFGFAEVQPAVYAAAMHAALGHIDSWIFDLDNSLYPSSANLFALIDERMGLSSSSGSTSMPSKRGASRNIISGCTARRWPG